MSSPSASNVNDIRKVVEEVSNNFNNASAKLLPLRSNSPDSQNSPHQENQLSVAPRISNSPSSKASQLSQHQITVNSQISNGQHQPYQMYNGMYAIQEPLETPYFFGGRLPDVNEISFDDTSSDSTKFMSPWRGRLYRLMNKEYSIYARALHYFFLVIILISIVTLCLSTVPSIIENPEAYLIIFTIDAASIFLFTIEFIANILSIPAWGYIKTVWFAIDLLTIIPFYIDLTYLLVKSVDPTKNQDTTVAAIQFLLLLRIFRIFKVFKKSGKLRIIAKAVRDSVEGVLVLILIIFVLVVFYSTLIFYSEQTISNYSNGVWSYADGTVHQFQSIPGCFFNTMLTLSGNPFAYARSAIGQIVMSLAVVTFLFIIAFPLTMISVTYSRAVRYFAEQSKLKKELKMKRQLSVADTAIEALQMQQHDDTKNNEFVNQIGIIHASPDHLQREVAVATIPKSSPLGGDIESGTLSPPPLPELKINDSPLSPHLFETPTDSETPSHEVAHTPDQSNHISDLIKLLQDVSDTDNLNHLIKLVETRKNEESNSILAAIRRVEKMHEVERDKSPTLDQSITIDQFASELSTPSTSAHHHRQRSNWKKVRPALQIMNAMRTTSSSPNLSLPRSNTDHEPSTGTHRRESRVRSGGRLTAGSIDSMKNLTEVSLKVVDWVYQPGPPKKPKSAPVKAPVKMGVKFSEIDFSDDEDDSFTNDELGEKYGWEGGDKLNMKLAVKNEEQFRKLMKFLSEF